MVNNHNLNTNVKISVTRFDLIFQNKFEPSFTDKVDGAPTSRST